MIFFLFLSLLCLLGSVSSLNNGVGRTPAMGWSSWNYFRCDINETIIHDVAEAIVRTGLRDAGYVYVNIDDCWATSRDSSGQIVADSKKFPSGMKALGDYLHSKGLKFGIYSDAGHKTCEGYPGSWGYEKQDALSYASWGVDYLKYDYCNMDGITESTEQTFTRMSRALNATHRPILFSVCSWGSGEPWKWGSKVAHSWRIGIDLFAAWDEHAARSVLRLPSFLQSVLSTVHTARELYPYAGPGGFNDLDMLVAGLNNGMVPYGIVQECPRTIPNCVKGSYISRARWGSVGGLTRTEQRTHVALWAMLASPMLLGNDPRKMSAEDLQILTAKEVIAVGQDPLGIQAKRAWAFPAAIFEDLQGIFDGASFLVWAEGQAKRWKMAHAKDFGSGNRTQGSAVLGNGVQRSGVQESSPANARKKDSGDEETTWTLIQSLRDGANPVAFAKTNRAKASQKKTGGDEQEVHAALTAQNINDNNGMNSSHSSVSNSNNGIKEDGKGDDENENHKNAPQVEIWVKKLSGKGKYAVLLLNGGKTAVDIPLVFSRDIPEVLEEFGRPISAAARAMVEATAAECVNRDTRCAEWTATGECEKNPDFMQTTCAKSCPNACRKSPEYRLLDLYDLDLSIQRQLSTATKKHTDGGVSSTVEESENKNGNGEKNGKTEDAGKAKGSFGSKSKTPTVMMPTALIRDTWLEEDVAISWGMYTARRVESHEGRLLTVTFLSEIQEAEARVAEREAWGSFGVDAGEEEVLRTDVNGVNNVRGGGREGVDYSRLAGRNGADGLSHKGSRKASAVRKGSVKSDSIIFRVGVAALRERDGHRVWSPPSTARAKDANGQNADSFSSLSSSPFSLPSSSSSPTPNGSHPLLSSIHLSLASIGFNTPAAHKPRFSYPLKSNLDCPVQLSQAESDLQRAMAQIEDMKRRESTSAAAQRKIGMKEQQMKREVVSALQEVDDLRAELGKKRLEFFQDQKQRLGATRILGMLSSKEEDLEAEMVKDALEEEKREQEKLRRNTRVEGGGLHSA